MYLKDWGEENLIKIISSMFKVIPTVTGIGDDCAVIPLDQNNKLLVTMDNLLEGIHFILSMKPDDLGYKSVMVNLSDIAAMGGEPKYIFLGLSLPKKTKKDWIENFLQGFKQACSEHNVVLLGGDTTGALEHIAITVTVLGKVKTAYAKYRSAAQVGDIICTTDKLSASPVGLRCLLYKISLTPSVTEAIKKHVRPQAHVKQGIFLSKYSGVHAMADISDGLHKDISAIMEASHVGAEINIDKLPIANEARKVCVDQGWNCESLALSGGEEYSLLVTIAPDDYKSISKEFEEIFGHSLYQIGTITHHQSLGYFQNRKYYNLVNQTFNHFGK